MRSLALGSVHLEPDGGGVGPQVDLIAELMGHPQAATPALGRWRSYEPSQRLGVPAGVGDLTDHQG
jgi:hypothetical protein